MAMSPETKERLYEFIKCMFWMAFGMYCFGMFAWAMLSLGKG